MTATPIRIALADDQPLFSAGLKMILRSQADMDFVGEAVNGEAAVKLSQETCPDVLLMDIRMPVMDGITATRTILETPAGAATKIIVLTTIQHDEAVVRAIQAGAAGLLTKDTTPDFLPAAIRTVHSGDSVIAPALTNELLRDYTTPSAGTTADPVAGQGMQEAIRLCMAKAGLDYTPPGGDRPHDLTEDIGFKRLTVESAKTSGYAGNPRKSPANRHRSPPRASCLPTQALTRPHRTQRLDPNHHRSR